MMRLPIGSVSLFSSDIHMPAALRVFGTVAASTTLIHGVFHGIFAKYSAASFISASLIPLAMVVITPVLPLRGSDVLRRSFLKSSSCWRKYATGRPETDAFSGRPLPLIRWQRPQAQTSGALPYWTTYGIFAWSSGNQSPTLKRLPTCARVIFTSLPGTEYCIGSGGGGGAPPRPRPPPAAAGGPGGGAGVSNPYAHGAGGSAARSSDTAAEQTNTDNRTNVHFLIIRPPRSCAEYTIRVVAAVIFLPIALAAQWVQFPTPNVPRLPDGKPNLSAPAPKSPDGHPDLSGVWVPRGRYI